MEERVKCKGRVPGRGRSVSSSGCTRNAVKDGFCWGHHPDRQTELASKWDAENKAVRAAAVKTRDISPAERTVLDAAEKWLDGADIYGMVLVAAIHALRMARASKETE